MKNAYRSAFAAWHWLASLLSQTSSNSFQKTGKHCLVVLAVVLFAAGNLFSQQTNWTGAVSTAWHTAGNWTAGVPDDNDIAYIPNVTNDPIISTSDAVAKSVAIDDNAELTITSGGTLTINGSTNHGLFLNNLHAPGKFTNNGIVNIGNSSPIGAHGIRNTGIIFNNAGGVININNVAQAGILNGEYSAFTNSGTINIGSAGNATMGIGLQNNSGFSNEVGGQININRSTSVGLLNDAGTFNNAATITIGGTTPVGPHGLSNAATFTNETGGQIKIDRASSSGLWNSAGTFTNSATITIGSNAASSIENGLTNDAIFNNGGQISIDRTTSVALANSPVTGSTFTNTATINIGSSAAVGLYGVVNLATFNNNSGQIKIDRSTSVGLWNDTGTFTNAATIQIGSTASVGGYCIYNEANFTNNVGGLINANNSTQVGVQNNAGTFINSATINIGSSALIGLYGVKNLATFSNVGGQINIDRSTSVGVWNYTWGTFTNSAILNIGSIAAVGVKCIYNEFIFRNNAGGVITANRSSQYAIENYAGNFENFATINIGGTAAIGTHGLVNGATFNNGVGGQINIDRATYRGLLNELGNFYNHGTIAIGGTVGVGEGGLVTYVGTSFVNYSDGQINIDRSTGQGIWNSGSFNSAGTVTIGNNAATSVDYGILNDEVFTNNSGTIHINRFTGTGIINYQEVNNKGVINIGSVAASGSNGIFNTAAFTNFAGSVLNINNVSARGIEHGTGTFTNAATINIGSLASGGDYGIRNSGTFNNTGGQIKIDNCSTFGLRNAGGTFTNAATLTIGSIAGVGTTGISNSATINNNAGGAINIDRSTVRGIGNTAGTFANAATINIGALAASSMQYGIDNDAAFTNSGTGQINIDHSTTYGIWNDAGSFTNNATVKIGEITAIPTLLTGSFTNSTGGLLKGTGSIAATSFTNAGGTLSPGYSPGKMTFTTSKDFSNSIMFMEVNGTGTAGVNYDQVVVNGTATLGGTLNLSVNYNFNSGDYVVLLTANQVSGTFGTLTGVPANCEIVYFPTEVRLMIPETVCGSIGTLTCGTAATQTLTGTGDWNLTTCGYNTPGKEKIYSFTPTTTGAHALQVTSATGTGFIDYMYKTAAGGCASNGWTCIGHTNSTTTFPTVTLTAGTEYYILLDGENIASSTQTFQINCPTVLTCPMNTTTTACQTQAAVNSAFAIWLATASGKGGCNGVLTNNSTGAPSACGGSSTVTFTYTSSCAPLTTTCQATFTVPTSPNVALTCPTNTTTAACQTQAAVNTAFATWLATATSTGGCNGVLTNNSVAQGGAPSACGGSRTVTFTYTSSCAPLTTTCQATFTVETPTNAVLTCPSNATQVAGQTQAAINAAFNTWLGTVSASGGCNGSLTNNNTGAPPASGGSTTVTFTYTSSCAPFMTNCTATFTVLVAQPIVLTCPTNTTTAACQTQAAVNSTFAAWLATASATGGCNGVLINNSTGAPSACGGSTTVIFTYTSSCLAPTTTCQATFTVPPAPTIVLTCPQNTTTAACQTQAAVNTAFTAWLATASASGGCNGVLTNNNTGAPSACGGSTTVIFTYTSSCAPTTTTCQATFTVPASPNVVLACPVNTTTTACQTQTAVNSAFATWLATAIASGGCNGVLTNNNSGAPSACGGSTTVIFTYTSSCAPTTTTCQATFTVETAPPVVLTCPTNTTTAACQTQAAVNSAFATWLATASASGGCNGVLTNNNSGAPSACGGSTTVTFTYTSSCAPTTTTCQATFTVPAAPNIVLTCPVNTTVSACLTQAQLDAQYVAWLASATASGGCNGVLTNNSPGAPSICVAAGTVRTVTFTYTSSCTPFMSTCTATFMVQPYPDFTVPANGAATVACPASATQPTPPVVLDACGNPTTPTGPVIVNNPNPITCEGTRTYTWTYTDCAGNTTPWSFVYTIERNDFIVPANGTATVSCPAAITTPTPPTIQSNCGETLIPTGPVTSATPVCEGTRTYTWTYTDCEGNTHPWVFTYTVIRNDFAVPANGAATVSCPALATQPTPPTVSSNCGETITPTGPVIGATPACEGTKTYTWTYTDCAGHSHAWSFIYTIERQPFFVPANGGATVACTDQTDVQPTPPTVTSNCGEILIPTVSSSAKNGCEGDRNWYFTYTDCEGNTATWIFSYHVENLDFTVPPSETVTVECPLNIEQPTPPVVYDNCGKLLTPTGPVITEILGMAGCEAGRNFTWTYKDCEGNTHTWSSTFLFDYTGDFFTYPDGVAYVGCLEQAQHAAPPTIYDNCGREIVPSGPVITEEISEVGCSGVRTFTYIYTDCGGNSHPWNFTYIANDTEPPVGTCPTGSGSADNPGVDVTNLSCIEEVPCPTNYDFTQKMQQLLAAGHFYDQCSGNDLIVTLDSWSAMWECSDPGGNGQFTFGRTFYFSIADQCGNEFPDLCSVTYSGVCQPITMFPATAWGQGEENGGINLATIQHLLDAYGPLKVGGGIRSLTLTQVQCVADLLPGEGGAGILANCNQMNCTGCNPVGPQGIKNLLAADAIAVELSLRKSVDMNGASMAGILSQGLGCIQLPPSLVTCSGGICQLHLFGGNGVEHLYPYTIGGLLDMVDYFLGGNLGASDTQAGAYATQLDKAFQNLMAAYSGTGQTHLGCDPGAGVIGLDGANKNLANGNGASNAKDTDELDLELSPNPASSKVNVHLNGFGGSDVRLTVLDRLGRLILVQTIDAGTETLQLDFSRKNLSAGDYYVRVVSRSGTLTKKLMLVN